MSRVESGSGLRQRDPRIREKAYLAFVAECPCIICAIRGVIKRPVEVAHFKCAIPEAGWRGFGHSEKGHDRNVSPLCSWDHRDSPDAQHRNRGGNERDWWERHGIYPPAFCAALYAAYEARESGEKVVLKFASDARLR